jgi:hypothetical protein
MKVNLNELEAAQALFDKVNGEPLENIQWFRDDELLLVPKREVDEWKFIGLSNTAFAVTQLKDEDRAVLPAQLKAEALQNAKELAEALRTDSLRIEDLSPEIADVLRRSLEGR